MTVRRGGHIGIVAQVVLGLKSQSWQLARFLPR